MIKEIKYNGITNSPSDYECPDGDLEGAIDSVNEDGSLKPVNPFRTVFTLQAGQEVRFVHATSFYRHFIIVDGSNNVLWRTENDDTMHTIETFAGVEIEDINALGNTLVVLCSDGIHYFLWKKDAYKYMGQGIPECPLSFGLRSSRKTYSGDPAKENFDITFDEINREGKALELVKLTDANKNTISNQVLAKVNEFINDIVKRGAFLYPFFVRYAYRLYDESLTHHSAPILMLPSTTANPFAVIDQTEVPDKFSSLKIRLYGASSILTYSPVSQQGLTELEEWTDIVKSIDVFISAPIYNYDQSKLCEGFSSMGKSNSFLVGWYGHHSERPPYDYLYTKHMLNEEMESKYVVELPRFPEGNIGNKIKDCHRFYFLHSFPVKEFIPQWKGVELTSTNRRELHIEEDYLTNIVTKEVMTDDYQTHDALSARAAHTYNARLNLIDVSRTHYKGFNTEAMVTYTNDNPSLCHVTTRLDTDSGEIVLKNETSLPLGSVGYYLYYPDSSAKDMYLTNSRTVKADLVKHTGLNGSFYFNGFHLPDTEAVAPRVTGNAKVPLANKIYTSEVNNAYYFPLGGINTVGTGAIYGIRSATKPISEGQFGYFPLYAFCSDGVWSLKVRDDGTFYPAQPTRLDVCINAKSISQLDDAVLFAAERGLMLLSGQRSVCISDVLQGDSFGIDLPSLHKALEKTGTDCSFDFIPFLKYLLDCRTAFDYVRQRILVFNPSLPYAYIYSLESKTWGMVRAEFKSAVSCYPYSYITTSDNRLVNISYDAPVTDIELTSPNMILVTRPMKLDAPDQLKTIVSIIQRGVFPKDSVSQVLYGSRDLVTWYPLSSSIDKYLRGFVASPYKYIRLAVFAKLRQGESIYGCSVKYDLKYTEKMR